MRSPKKKRKNRNVSKTFVKKIYSKKIPISTKEIPRVQNKLYIKKDKLVRHFIKGIIIKENSDIHQNPHVQNKLLLKKAKN
jgi:hypothetical protein